MKRALVSIAGALASAALLALYARAEGGWFVLGFVALVPWLLALGRARSMLEALGAAVAMSVAFAVAVFGWLPGAIERYAQATPAWPWFLVVVSAPLLEPQFLSFALVRHLAGGGQASGPRVRLRAVLLASAAYVGTELVANKLLFDTLGLGLYPSRYLRQGADLLGVHGLTLMLLLANESVVAAWGGWTKKRSVVAAFRPAALMAGLIAADAGYGWMRCAQFAARGDASTPATVVGVVQANVTNYAKLRAERGAFGAVRSILDEHYALSDELRARSNPDVIVWPETVYPTTFGAPKSEAGAAFDAEILAFAGSRGVPLVFGAYDARDGREYNAAFFVNATPDAHPQVTAYRKSLLFPFTERLPSWLDSTWMRERLPWAGHWQSGPGPEVVQMNLREGKRLSVVPLICYDALSPRFVAEAADRGADLIVTLSNDSWFPDARAPRLHLISAAFRSIETRLPQVRATNSGISGMISPTGDLLAAAGWDERRTVAARVPLAQRVRTPAVVVAPWLGPVLLSAALLALLKELSGHRRVREVLRAAIDRRRKPGQAQNTQHGTRARRSGERGARARSRAK